MKFLGGPPCPAFRRGYRPSYPQFIYVTIQFYYKKEDVCEQTNKNQILEIYKLANYGPLFSKSQNLGQFLRLGSNFLVKTSVISCCPSDSHEMRKLPI